MAELQGFTFLFGGLLGAGGVGNDALTLSGIAAGSPVCGQPSLSQNHSLTASVVASGSPVCGTTTLTQNHGLTATGLAAGSPVLQGTALGQNHAFTLSGLATGSPVCGTLVLGQVHVFSVVAVSAGFPQLGNPTIQSTGSANWWIYWYSFEVMTMQKNQAGQSITMLAIDTTTGKPKTGDAANLTAYVSKDDGAVTVLGDVSAAETDATNAKGLYIWTLTQAETNADKLVFSGKSVTANVELIPVTVYTTSGIDGGGALSVSEAAQLAAIYSKIHGVPVVLSSTATNLFSGNPITIYRGSEHSSSTPLGPMTFSVSNSYSVSGWTGVLKIFTAFGSVADSVVSVSGSWADAGLSTQRIEFTLEETDTDNLDLETAYKYQVELLCGAGHPYASPAGSVIIGSIHS